MKTMEPKTIKEIEKYLNDNNVEYTDIGNSELPNSVSIDVEWGDWKHDHLCLTHYMSEIGYNEVGEIVTEEDGSDCYSATHIYMFASKEMIAGLHKLFETKQ